MRDAMMYGVRLAMGFFRGKGPGRVAGQWGAA